MIVKRRTLLESVATHIEEGIDPPVGRLPASRSSNTRKCVACGRLHDTIVEDRQGNRLHEFDKCEHCLFAPTT